LEHGDFDIVVTSYEFALKCELKVSWLYVIVDEGHRLKNNESALYQVLVNVKSPRTLLTGTPVQNNIGELYNLLHFVNEDVFRDAFRDDVLAKLKDIDWRRAALEDDDENEELTRFHHAIRPFLLRRRKEDTDVVIPPKVECILYVQMTPMQKHYYKASITKSISSIKGVGGGLGLQNTLMNLRKCVNHPYLFDGAEPQFDGDWKIGEHIIEYAGKMRVLDVLLKKLHRERHKVLLFCTMTRVLDILQDYLEYRGWSFARLDGSIRAEERTIAVNEFQGDSDVFCFLLSTRAGGQGLNLTEADTVIFFDMDFNPQIDLQAQARAHRIGQTRPVTVIRLLMQHRLVFR
jgi:SNF2 family DNA or RNA helicase